ncbi:hypothetical protein BY996DRAFT_4576423 [Phakopsora pachyrhizi]|uniref:Uncharacterized protein n=1 Tax=Phakopsora pachyrhizi TaxID=170000 RepID=A0AAV0AKI8_PHAPC|nr:hypothetical protein BY996DRAFT_4576423 [Phakopsora pachyrhizi]CAH7667844.1 hypothetical protein PPACK8108_LOCUS2278 [Phakopsora pachyrhizi]
MYLNSIAHSPESFHPFDRRQLVSSYGGGDGTILSGMLDYTIHARILGLNPTMPNDLIASMLFAIFFGILVGGCVYVGIDKRYRNFSVFTLFGASVFSFLGFAIRAGISNSIRPSRLSFIAECIFFIIAQILLLDTWVMRSRDELIDFLEYKLKIDLSGKKARDSIAGMIFNSETRFAFFSRLVLLPICLILYVAGYFMIPDPANGIPSDSSSRLRGVSSFLLVFLLTTMNFVMILSACVNLPPWIPQVVLFGTSAMLWIPALYSFCLVAVVIDSSPVVRSKTFFYFGFGVGHGLAIIALLSMTRVEKIWSYRVGPEFSHEDGPPPPRS